MISVLVEFPEVGYTGGVEITPCEVVRDLKARLCEEIELHLPEQHVSPESAIDLAYEGDVLTDRSQVLSCGVCGGEVLSVMLSKIGKAFYKLNLAGIEPSVAALADHLNTDYEESILEFVTPEQFAKHPKSLRILQAASSNRWRVSVQRLIPKCTPNQIEYLLSANSNDVYLVRLLLKAGADPDSITHWIFELPDDVCVELVRAGASLEVIFRKLLSGRFSAPTPDLLRQLLRLDPTVVSIPFKDDKLPILGVVSHEATLPLAEVLLDFGAQPNVRTGSGLTPLHAACSRKGAGAVQVLITKGADINAQTNSKETPLMSACRADNVAAAKLLIENGADVSIRDWHDMSAFDWVRSPEMKAVLLNCA